ncbi:MAG: hypothetical protein JWR85_552 [Marmoricola sp.]|jgi:hypothetical protein|nr:hypothetical protein [Marmoricola sp.]
MEHIGALEEQLARPIGEIAPTNPAQTDLVTRRQHGLSSLLSLRGDLRGVYAFADVVEESVRWSA